MTEQEQFKKIKRIRKKGLEQNKEKYKEIIRVK
jgi:hypothetical protein